MTHSTLGRLLKKRIRERQAFERWAASNISCERSSRDPDKYLTYLAEIAWKAWRARSEL